MKRFLLVLLTFFVHTVVMCEAPWSFNDRLQPSRLISNGDVDNATSASGTMITAGTSGHYYLTENLHMSPSQESVTCLKITTSNVIVDLRGYSIMSDTVATGAGMIAIEVASDLSNIIIMNGTLCALNGTGIKINTGCSDIQIKNMKIDNCTLVGMAIDTCDDIHIDETIITRCNGSHADAADEGAAGLRLRWCNRVRVTDSHFDGNQVGAINRDAAGVYVRGCTHCEFVRCSAIQNKAGSTATNAGYGFRLRFQSNNAIFEDCIAGCNQSQDGAVYGFDIDDSNGLIMKNCNAHGNMAAGTDAGDSAYGFRLSGTDGGGAQLENCVANKTNGASNVYGFEINNSDYNYIVNCQARNQTTSSSEAVNVYGFYSTAGQGNAFVECNSFGNKGSTHASSNAAGYCLSGAEKYSNILRCKAKANNGNTGAGYGIWLDSATYCTIRGNEIFVNVGTASGHGIKDDASSSVSCYFENFAYGNGSADGLKLNNFDVALSPNDSTNYFPVQEAFLTDFTSLKQLNAYDNVELIERADTTGL